MDAATGSSIKPAVIAIGDLHGYYPALKRLLASIDRRHQIFAADNPDQLASGVRLVFTGDYIDRGNSALKIIDRLQRLQHVNGRSQVITLFGNHELLALEAYDVACELAQGIDSRLTASAMERYGALTVHGYRGNGGQRFILEFGSSERSALRNYAERMSRKGDVGLWVRSLLPYYETTIAKRKVLFVHADLSEELRDSGALERYKQELLKILKAPTADMGGTARKYGGDWFKTSAGFFWNRSFWKLKAASGAAVRKICDKAGVDFIVTGHTPQPPRIACYGGRIFDIDVGMSPWFWKPPDRENVPWALLLWRSGRVAGFSASGEEQEFRSKEARPIDGRSGDQLQLFVEAREKTAKAMPAKCTGTDRKIEDRPSDPYATFARRIKELEQACNPNKGNLHFDRIAFADAALFRNLAALTKHGLDVVYAQCGHDVERIQRAMVDPGHELYGHWYTLFQLIDSAATLVGSEARQGDIPRDVLEELVALLVETFQCAPRGWADLTKRNYEALGDLLFNFDQGELTLLARRTAENFSSTVREFVDSTISEVDAARRERAAPTTPK